MSYRVGVVGATGAVGTTILEVLAERRFPVREVVPFASERSAGRRISFAGGEIECRPLADDSILGLDLVLCSAGGAISAEWAPRFVDAGAVVVDNLTIDPDVPRSVGVRFVEFNAVRFEDGQPIVQPILAQQLDRFVSLLNRYPNTSLLIVGHADQRGDEAGNLTLSQQRADAVAAYFVAQGIATNRLGTQAAGESNLLTQEENAAAYLLNRRTEFVIFGLFDV